MSLGSWQVALSIMLRHLRRPERPLTVSVVGMGQDLRGDDGLGPSVARRLRDTLCASNSLLVLDAGPAPENFTGAIRAFAPDLVILIDAAQMDEIAGRIHLLDRRDCVGLSASTHTLPPHVMADYLTQELGCEVTLLGIQPRQTAVDSQLSDAARQSIEQAASGIAETLVLHEVAYMRRMEGRASDGRLQ
jgi:hydrogenase 3 maturation protease